ncbi:hypothetical protein FHT22_003169 [Pedobacter sp. SG918]|nr:hypothetical protein [Pedobacter sp. SG918]
MNAESIPSSNVKPLMLEAHKGMFSFTAHTSD